MKSIKQMSPLEIENFIQVLKKDLKQKKKIQINEFRKNRNTIIYTVGAMILKENPALFSKDDIVKKMNKAEVEKRLQEYNLTLTKKIFKQSYFS